MILIIIFVIIIGVTLAVFIYNKLTCGICKCSRHLVGKLVIVTGGNAGIGFETAKDLAERGARVIIGCRNESRGTTARDRIIKITGNKDVQYQPLDLASFSSVRAFAKNILDTENKLDILINNAAVFDSDNVKTEDGLLWGMQINHFGPFLLTNLLLPLLKSSAPSRIINVSSKSHEHGAIDFQNLNMENETDDTFGTYKVYSNSKLCNVLMTVELDRRLKGTGVTTNTLNPGLVATEILSESKKYWIKMLKVFNKPFSKNWWEGAQTTIYLAVSPEVYKVSGRYFVDCKETKTSRAAQDSDVARKLWEVSEILVKGYNSQ